MIDIKNVGIILHHCSQQFLTKVYPFKVDVCMKWLPVIIRLQKKPDPELISSLDVPEIFKNLDFGVSMKKSGNKEDVERNFKVICKLCNLNKYLISRFKNGRAAGDIFKLHFPTLPVEIKMYGYSYLIVWLEFISRKFFNLSLY